MEVVVLDEEYEESPASPQLPDPEEGLSCAGPNPTRVHLQIQGDHGLQFAIDRVGKLTREQAQQAQLIHHKINPNASSQQIVYDLEPEIVMTGVMPLKNCEADRVAQQPQPGPRPRPTRFCWNCDSEDHTLDVCPTARNGQKVMENRKRFMAAKGTSVALSGTRANSNYNSNKRYHEEQELSPFGQFKAGELSVALRSVLDLDPNQLPLHIYRMRVYGYPPGWLEQAVQESSPGLKLYGHDTISMELNAGRKNSSIKADNIVSYPGYNVPLPPGTTDESRQLGYPPFSERDSIGEMVRRLSESRSGASPILNLEKEEREEEAVGGWDSLNGFDEPQSNRSGLHGLGRGKAVLGKPLPSSTRPLPQPSNYISPSRLHRDDQRRKVELVEMDERYLPRKLVGKSEIRNKRCRSPSLLPSTLLPSSSSGLRNESEQSEAEPRTKRLKGDGLQLDGRDETNERRNVPTSSSSQPSPSHTMQPDSSDDETGSSPDIRNDEPSLLPSSYTKNTYSNNSALDPLVHTIPDDDDDGDDVQILNSPTQTLKGAEEENDDCVCVLSVIPSKKEKLCGGPVVGQVVVVDLDSPALSHTSDWEQVIEDKDKDSSTDDDISLPPQSNNRLGERCQKDVVLIEDEDWDQESKIEENPSKATEFIPINSELARTKEVLLAQVEESGDEEEEVSFSSLPSFDKFAVGMPEMVFEEEPLTTRRLDTVLKILKSRRNHPYL